MLEKIKSPKDVKKLNSNELKILCKDIRERIIDVISRTGGHLAPSLGTVELTASLLKVFDPLKNRIVWDVGHQSYAYKILTGRNEKFDTLRQYGGISGFNNIFESKYDAFGVGHSSTSISAALGIYVGKELQNKKEKIIAVIGDGAMSAGEAFEGLNNIGGMNKNVIIILNDNKMSISKNVGAMHHYLANILTGRRYNKIKKEVWDAVQKFPSFVRNRIVKNIRKLEESILNMVIPNSLFEDLGFKYIGPIDGHNLSILVKIFSNVKQNIEVPCLVHVVTKKGKGFKFAEKDATKFHGISPFDDETGEKKATSSTKSYSQIFGETMMDIAENDKKVVAITAAMASGTGLSEYAKKFPDRFFDVGIAEQHAVTFAAGLAIEGMKPFVAIYSTFLQRAYDQISHDVALQKLPVKFALDRGGLVGEDGPTHHGTFDLSYLRCIPNMTILASKDRNEFEKMLRFMQNFESGPIAIRYPRGKIDNFSELSAQEINYGKSELIFSGEKMAIITIGSAFKIGYELYKMLKIKKTQPFLINARFVKPIDSEMLQLLSRKKVKEIITIENNTKKGGFGSAILEKSNELGLKFDIKIFGIPDDFITYGETDKLLHSIGLESKNILKDIINENE